MNSHADIPVPLMAQFNRFIADHVGLHFPQDRWHDLLRGIDSAARDSGTPNTRSYIERLMTSSLSRHEIEMLASHLTVGETYFFRDEKCFTALAEHVLPELIRRRRKGEKYLRIWSAGCCTGEEPFSIMILLNRLLPDLDDWLVTFLATDINPRFLEKAAGGIYGEWSFRATPRQIRELYFTRTDAGRFRIDSRIRRGVTFCYLNLAEDVYPSLLNNTSAMDIIFCRNVLMYFSPETAGKVICNFQHCLVEDGCLIVSPIETPVNLPGGFVREHYTGVVVYRKHSNRGHITDTSTTFSRTDESRTSFPPPAVATPASIEQLPETDDEIQPIIHITEKMMATPETGPLEQARLLYEQGCYAEATEKLRTAVRDPGDTEALVLLTRSLANQGRLAEAGACCKQAIAADKLNPAAHYLYAVVLQEQGQLTDAVASLNRVLYLDPDFAMACIALGNLLRQQGRLKEARRHYQRALLILEKYPQGASFPEAEGMTVGRLREIMCLALDRGTAP